MSQVYSLDISMISSQLTLISLLMIVINN